MELPYIELKMEEKSTKATLSVCNYLLTIEKGFNFKVYVRKKIIQVKEMQPLFKR